MFNMSLNTDLLFWGHPTFDRTVAELLWWGGLWVVLVCFKLNNCQQISTMWCLLECWSDSWHLPPPKRTNTPCCRKTRAMEGWPRNPLWERLRFSSIHKFKASPNRKDRPHASTRCSQCILCTVWILSGASVMKDAKIYLYISWYASIYQRHHTI